MKQELVRLHGIRHFDVDGDAGEFDAGARFLRLPRITLSYSYYRVPVRLEFPEVDAVRQRLVISGSGIVWGNGISDEIDPVRSFIARGDAPTWVRYSCDFEQLVVSIKTDILAKQLRHLTGAAPKTFPCFAGGVDLASPEQRRFQRLVRFVADELSSQNSPLPKNLLLEYEDALVTAFAIANVRDADELFDREAQAISPWQVRATEEFIEANWQRPITVEVLAEQIGASARSIFKTFKDARGYSPMAFLKRTRLIHARKDLQSATPSVTVTGTGLAAGFQNLSHFAKDYAREFGETPSETLRRARSLNVAKAGADALDEIPLRNLSQA